ncbi:MAG: transcription elongation factor GreA [Clostridia bacterium]|nr:transcription elongation factor GreA [Clostridia bacterium]
MADEKRTVVTEEGLRKLQEQYDFRVNTRRPQIIEAIEIARGFGDLSENAEYTAAREEQAKNEAEITRLKAIIDNAIVVSESEISTDRVSVGTTVRYMNLSTGKECEYAIVGSEEARPEEGSISSECPIGMGLLGKKIGDTAEVETPRGVITLQVLDIHR